MGKALSTVSNLLAEVMCGGSLRRLIAGWWYAVLAVSLVLTIMSFWTYSTRTKSEGFSSVWSAIVVILLSVGGTMVMRKFHSSFAVGLFMGSVVAAAQFFFLMFLIYLGYAHDREYVGLSRGENPFRPSFVSFKLSYLDPLPPSWPLIEVKF